MAIVGLFTTLKMVGVAIGVGTTTILLAQSLAAAQDNKITKDEQNLLYVVMVVSRAGILLLFLAQSAISAYYYGVYGVQEFYTYFYTTPHSLTWMFISILFTTYVFIDYKVISRMTGVAILLSAWYALIFVLAWPMSTPIQVDSFVLAYLIFAIATYYCIKTSHLFTVSSSFIPKKK